MAILITSRGGYIDQVGENSQGYPIYLYHDPRSGSVRYVVVLPDGKAVYSDPAGNITSATGQSSNAATGAMLFGLGGLALAGPLGGIVGAIAGAVVGPKIFRKP